MASILLLQSCDSGGEVRTVRGTRVLYSLLTAQRPEALEQREDAPLQVTLAGPLRALSGDLGVLPSLVAAPPARVRYKVPLDTPSGAELHVALGFDASAYDGAAGAEVGFSITLDGALVHDSVLKCGEDVPFLQRAWERVQLEVRPGSELELATRVISGAATATPAAFGLLDVVAEVEYAQSLSSPAAPNLVLIVIDTLRADRLGCYGYEKDLSPNIDALAESGKLFERTYAPSSWTWPSTASLLTGRTPPAHGVMDPESCFLAHDFVTLAEQLHEGGFATAACSTNPLIVPEKNFDQGFDEFHTTEWGDAWSALQLIEPWLRARDGERFFLYLQFTEPHTPYEPRADLVSEWVPEPPENWQKRAINNLQRRKFSGESFNAQRLSSFAGYCSDLYDAEVATADHSVAEVMALLDELQLREQTVVAITSDHGDEFLDHGMMGHGSQLFDELVHVPLILNGPGLTPGVVEAPTELTHVGGTLLDVLGVERGDSFAGPSLMDIEADYSKPLFFTSNMGRWVDDDGLRRPTHGPLHALRVDSMFFVYRPELASEAGGEAWRLYDLAQDPRAEHDISALHPELTATYKQQLESWFEREQATRPAAVSGGSHTLEQLEDIGYIGR